MHTTLNKIRACSPCNGGWKKLLKNLGKTKADDELLKITTILDSNGLDDALWCLRSVDGYQREIRLYAVDCARSVQHLLTDPRSIAAIDIAERHAYGKATDYELSAASAEAWSAASDAAWSAASDAARSAVRVAASDAARSAAWSAARSAASEAASDAASDAAWSAAWSAAMAAASEVQSDLLRIVCAEIEQR